MVVIQVDLASGAVRTYQENSLASAFSQSALQVTQVSALSQPATQDSEVKQVTPTTPARIHASQVSTATQTTCAPSSLNSSINTATSEYSTEVTPLDKSMWAKRSPSTTSQEDYSTTLTDTSRNFINTTYFEESSEATSQMNDSSIHTDSPDASKTRDVIQLDRLVSRGSSPLQVMSESSDDSSLTRSTITLLAKSDPLIFTGLSSACPPPPLELKEIQSHADHSYSPPVPEGVESECQGPESDRESYYTCEDDASEKEDETPVKRKLNLSTDVAQHLNSFEKVDWIVI